ncbi:MAG: ribbon-helix-helix domain-containing protein [Desulfurococcales archaeon]|nr:ribbon-helix-helix domain-containing protein [Desulfurococcales archaeon]
MEELVEMGVYESRSEALRDLIRISAENMKRAKLIAEAMVSLFRMEEKIRDIPVRLESALEKLLAERGRF